MFVYHGVISQATTTGAEYVVVILPSRVAIGAPFILLRYHSLQHQPCEIDHNALEGIIEENSEAADAQLVTASSTRASFQIAGHGRLLRLSLNTEGPETVTSLMTLVMKCPITEHESLLYEPTLFLGPVQTETQPLGSLIALVLFRKQRRHGGAGIHMVCIAWGAITASTPLSEIFGPGYSRRNIEKSKNDQNQPPMFMVNSDSHEFKGNINEGRDVLHITLCDRFDPSNSITVASTQIEALQPTLSAMGSKFTKSEYIFVVNDLKDDGETPGEAVSCTITEHDDGSVDEFLTRAGLFLAVAGLFTGIPAAIATGITIAGVPIAAAPYLTQLFRHDKETNGVLFPGDILGANGTYIISTSYFKVEVVRLIIEEQRAYLDDNAPGKYHLTMRRYVQSTYKYKLQGSYLHVKDILSLGGDIPIFSIPLETPHHLVRRRLLLVHNISVCSTKGSVFPPPYMLEQGDILEYDAADVTERPISGMQGNHYAAHDWMDHPDNYEGAERMFTYHPRRHMSVVHWKNDDKTFGQFFTLLQFPDSYFDYTTQSKYVLRFVLEMHNADIVATEGYGSTRLIGDGAGLTPDDRLRFIQKYDMDEGPFWAYSFNEPDWEIWAYENNPSHYVAHRPGKKAYFMVRSWESIIRLAKGAQNH